VTLRLRLLLVFVAIVAAGLVVADVATYTQLRSYLFSQVDQQLQGDASTIAPQVGRALLDPVFNRPILTPVGLWAEVIGANGTPLPSSNSLPAPQLPASLPAAAGNGSLFNASSTATNGAGYRVLAEPINAQGEQLGTLVLAMPLNAVHHTLGRLLIIEFLVSLAVLVGLGALTWWTVRRGLRPLEEMATTAGAIAAGDLSRRVEPADETTEVGRLGQALNTMLGEIEDAFAARAASEERLRRFLADASHELRTPLTSIRGYAEIFDRGARDRPEDLATSMRHIRAEANRMSVLVDDLLLLARLDRERPLAMEDTELGRIVGDAVDAARVAAGDREITLATGAPVDVSGDALRLRQVVDNLLANALGHTPEGTPVAVQVVVDNGTALLTVSDRGPGIAPGEQRHIFEPFHRADPSRARTTGGVGLGLAIVSAIAHAHGGTVGVVSPATVTADGTGAGATFWVRLPLAPVAERLPGLPPPPATGRPGTTGTRGAAETPGTASSPVPDGDVNEVPPVVNEVPPVVTEATEATEGTTGGTSDADGARRSAGDAEGWVNAPGPDR